MEKTKRKVQINGNIEWVDFDQIKVGDKFIIDEFLNQVWKAESEVFLNENGIKTIYADEVVPFSLKDFLFG